ncbi:4849_t:CDS:2, partial [Cetraspora pellucida]
ASSIKQNFGVVELSTKHRDFMIVGLVAPAVDGKPTPTATSAPPLSTECKSAFLEFITDNSTEKCLPPKELIRLTVIADPKANASTVQDAIITFATNVCPVSEKCGDAAINQISEKGQQLISTGCAKDLNNSNPIAVLALS